MLVLSRKLTQEITIGDNITVTVLEYREGKVKLGITAPKDMPVHRKEVRDAIERQNAQAPASYQHTEDNGHAETRTGRGTREAGAARATQAA